MVDYEDQLDRAIQETPEIGGDRDRLELPEPDVRQEGHVTVFENFQATLDRLSRDEATVLKYLQNDLGTSAQIDESGRARFTGDFTADRIRNALESFSDTYVRCPECGLPDTRLVEEGGAQLLKCDACGALSATG